MIFPRSTSPRDLGVGDGQKSSFSSKHGTLLLGMSRPSQNDTDTLVRLGSFECLWSTSKTGGCFPLTYLSRVTSTIKWAQCVFPVLNARMAAGAHPFRKHKNGTGSAFGCGFLCEGLNIWIGGVGGHKRMVCVCVCLCTGLSRYLYSWKLTSWID